MNQTWIDCMQTIAEAMWEWAYDIEDDALACRIDDVIAYIDTITGYACSAKPVMSETEFGHLTHVYGALFDHWAVLDNGPAGDLVDLAITFLADILVENDPLYADDNMRIAA